MKTQVDHNRCRGIGMCEMAAPTVFEVRDDGFAHVLTEVAAEQERPNIEEAVANCPTQAISITD